VLQNITENKTAVIYNLVKW